MALASAIKSEICEEKNKIKTNWDDQCNNSDDQIIKKCWWVINNKTEMIMAFASAIQNEICDKKIRTNK